VPSDENSDRERIFVFGGYGGMGYGRRNLDDLFVLEIQQKVPDDDDEPDDNVQRLKVEWSKPATKGKPPEKRSGHQAAAVGERLYIFGGSNSATQQQDLHLLDMRTMTWSMLNNTSLGVGRWGHSAYAVLAIPHWKVFLFGGNTVPLGK
jgi:dynein heavy chain